MATTSFTLKQTLETGGSGLQRTYAAYTSGPSVGASFALVEDSALKSDDFISASAVTSAGRIYSFTANVYKRTEIELFWQLGDVLTTATTSSYVPVEMFIVASSEGDPITPLDGREVVTVTAANFRDSIIDTQKPYIKDGNWVYYSMFIKYASTSDSYYDRVAVVSVQIPRDYGSTNDLWRHVPEYYRSLDETYAQNTAGYDGSQGGPLYRFLDLFGWELDKIRTTIYDTMRINDPDVVHSSAIDALAKQTGVELSKDAIGTAKLRTILRNIGYIQRTKGTLNSIEAYITAITACNLTTDTSTRPIKFNVHPQRVNLVTDPLFKQGSTTTDTTDPIQRKYAALSSGGRTHGWGVYVDKTSSTIWTARSAAEANSWAGVTYGNGLFVAVSGDGTNRVMTSPNGTTWTARSASGANQWTTITYGNGVFVALARTGSNRAMTSPNGITWTSQAIPGTTTTWSTVTYGGGVFVGISTNGSLASSPDGVTWTLRTMPENNTWRSVTYGNGLFVAVSNTGTNRVMTSPDGITWTARSAAEANSWRAVTYGNGLFVAVADSGTNRVMTSPDGITWTARSAAEANSWRAVTYGNGSFVAVSSDGTNRVMTSPDGITWTARSASEANSWITIAYGDGMFVAVSDSGTNRVMTNTDGPVEINVGNGQVTVTSPRDANVYIYSRGSFSYNNSLSYYFSANSSRKFAPRFVTATNMLSGLEAAGGSESVTFYDSWNNGASATGSSSFPQFSSTSGRTIAGSIPSASTVTSSSVIPVFYFPGADSASVSTSFTFSTPMVEPRNSSGDFFTGDSTKGGFIPSATNVSLGASDYRWGTNDGSGANTDFSYYTADNKRSRTVAEYIVENYVAPVTFVKNQHYVINWDVLE